jgi:hypothetical protein
MDNGDWNLAATDKYQQFYEYWRSDSARSNFHNTFPYKLPLGADLNGEPFLPFGSGVTFGNQIVVTRSYDETFRRLLRLREDDKGSRRGVALTGQPGVGESSRQDPPPRATTNRHIHSPGKTTFLNFLLARLISARQVVLLYGVSGIRLFFKGRVYSRPAVYGFGSLPRRPGAQYSPIWMLTDIDNKSEALPFPTGLKVWPIQASSPNPARWKVWQKQYGAALWGMPLWDMKELMEGYAFSLFSLSTIDPGHVVQ